MHPTPTSTTRGILVVDDEACIRNLVADALVRDGYSVYKAATGTEAVEVARRHVGQIGAALVDLRLPGMNGVEVLAALRLVDTTLRVCLTGGCVENPDELRRAGAACVVHKPFRISDVAKILQGLASAAA